MPFDQSPISRRTVAKGAAWSVPAVAVAAAAPALAASSHTCGNQVVGTKLTYYCETDFFGVKPLGIWTVELSTTIPTCVHVGEPIPAPALSVKVTTSPETGDTFRGLGNAAVVGTSDAKYSVTGAVVNPGERTAQLIIPETPIPDTGPIVSTATGNGADEIAAAAPGMIQINVGTFTAAMTEIKPDGATGATFHITSAFDPEGQNTLLGTIEVVA